MQFLQKVFLQSGSVHSILQVQENLLIQSLKQLPKQPDCLKTMCWRISLDIVELSLPMLRAIALKDIWLPSPCSIRILSDKVKCLCLVIMQSFPETPGLHNDRIQERVETEGSRNLPVKPAGIQPASDRRGTCCRRSRFEADCRGKFNSLVCRVKFHTLDLWCGIYFYNSVA